MARVLGLGDLSSAPCNLPRPVTILDLPPDVLLIIFRYVSKDIGLPGEWDDYQLALNITDPSPYPNRDRYLEHPFPESLASIRPLWRDVMSNISIFWTQLVIRIGRDPTPLSRIRQYLSWSQKHPLDIYVLRRVDPLLKDQNEKAQLESVFDLLLPHVGRWRILRVCSLCSSSLPLPRVQLVGRAHKLEALILEFIVDDLVGSTGTTLHLGDEFETPVLKKISMGGVHFRESYVDPFPQLAMPPQLYSLAITGYHSQNEAFALVDLLACLESCKELVSLELDNLNLNGFDVRRLRPPIIEAPRMPRWGVSFIDMGGDVIAEYGRLLNHPFIDCVSYTRCGLTTPLDAKLLHARRVIMEEIHSPAALFESLAASLSSTVLGEVEFTNCGGLTTDVLRVLTDPTTMPDPEAEADDEEPGGIWICPTLEELMIIECTQFRSTDVRAFVEARRKAHEATGFVDEDDPEFVVTSVNHLYVRGCCELVPEDREWLHANVPYFQWDDFRGGYEWRPLSENLLPLGVGV